MLWTSEQASTLSTLWAAGLTGGEIAKEMRVTRNAAMGKLNRLGLVGGDAPRPKRKPKPRPERAPRSRSIFNPGPRIRRAKPTLALVPPPPAPEPLMKTLMELDDHSCKWPVGDPKQAGFGYCGIAKGEGVALSVPYCEHHMRIAYQPATERQRSREMNYLVRRAAA